MAFKVKAKQKGYYGYRIRKPGEVFHIERQSEFGSWMTAVGWTPPRVKPSEVDPDATGDAKLLGFKGSKPKYVEGDIEIDLTEALQRACDEKGLSVAEWNALAEKERRAYTGTAVKLLIEEELAAREDDEGDESDGEDDDEGDEDDDT